jgi:integrase
VTEVVPGRSSSLAVGGELLRARQLAANFRAANARKAYQFGMDQFRAWCAAQQPPLEALPAQPLTVALDLSVLARCARPPRSAGGWTDQRRASAGGLRLAHRRCGGTGGLERHPAHPRRRTDEERRPAPVITALVASLGTSLGDVRDRALLLICFAGALRQFELVALDVEDVPEDDDGLVVTIRRAEGDQDAPGDIRGSLRAAVQQSAQSGAGKPGWRHRASPTARHFVQLRITGAWARCAALSFPTPPIKQITGVV